MPLQLERKLESDDYAGVLRDRPLVSMEHIAYVEVPIQIEFTSQGYRYEYAAL